VRVGQLLALPRADLTSRFGPELIRRIDQATGQIDEVILAHHPEPQFSSQWNIEHPTTSRRVLKQILLRLLERIAEQMAPHQRGILRLECWFSLEKPYGGAAGEDDRVQLLLGLFEPTTDVQHLLSLLEMRLERLSFCESGSIRNVARVKLVVNHSARLEEKQHELFNNSAERCQQAIGRLVDRLSGRLGEDCVVGTRLAAGVLPERAFCDVSLKNNRKRKSRHLLGRAIAEPTDKPRPFERPLRIKTCPQRIQVISTHPEGTPRSVHYRGEQHHIVHHWGPERIETLWWEGTSVRRDYYCVETDAGLRLWLFRRLDNGKWFLHGIFE